LTPAQFAEMFLAFGHNVRERSPHNDNDDATSAAAVASPDREDVVNDGTDHASQLLPSASPMRDENEDEPAGIQTPQTRFLVRENAAFKKIVEQDAHSILTLQRALETQKRLCALKEVEIMDRQKELQISEDRIARLQKEREEKLEREIELMETIRILKLEIDKMTLETGTVFDTTKIASMETELKAQQTHILKLEASLREKEKQNFDLQTETDYLRNQQKETKTHPIVSFDTTTSAEEITLSDQVDQSTEDGMLRSMSSWTDILGDISKRLALLEKEKEEKGTKDQELYEQMNEIRSRLGLGPDKKDIMMFKVTNSPEEIEAIPLAAKAQEKADSSCKYLLCCDWGVVVEN
jgi:chromosome segregation ATPase